MPNCFQLIRKSDPEAGPVVLATVDEEMCDHFNMPCDPKEWFCEWYDCIGFRIATGDTFDSIKTEFEAYVADGQRYYIDLLAILGWLDTNFTTNAFYQPKSMMD